MKTKNILSLVVFVLILITLPLSLAQAATVDEQRLGQETIDELAPTEKVDFEKDQIDFSHGGWFSSTYIHYDDLDYDNATKDYLSSDWYQDFRYWAKFTYKKIWSTYLRLKDIYVIRKASSVSYTGIGSDNEGPTVDTGYASLNLGAKTKTPIVLTVGRQYIYLGEGISYANIHDGLSISGYFKKLFYKCFFAHTLPHEDNVDESVPDYKDDGKRIFYGLEVASTIINFNVIYAYALIQRDLSGMYELTPEPSQDYSYNSEYYGFGFRGEPIKTLRYWLEFIKENGKDWTDAVRSALERKDINAWALDAGVRYEPEIALSPRLELEYSFGSGDDSRTSVTDTKNGGNTSGDDDNFLYFGGYYAGYALAPRLSNLRIYKVDISFKPLEKLFKFGKNVVVGAKYFKYYKVKKDGGIYDIYADNAGYRDIGDEINAYIYWQINKQLYFNTRLGLFYPGKSYTNRDHYTYISGRLIFTF